MEPPLIVEERDSKWKLLESTIKLFDERKIKKIISKHGFSAMNQRSTKRMLMFYEMFEWLLIYRSYGGASNLCIVDCYDEWQIGNRKKFS